MDKIIVNTTHEFSFRNRLKILLGKPLHCSTEICVEHDDAKVIGNANVTGRIESLFPKKHKNSSYVALEKEKEATH